MVNWRFWDEQERREPYGYLPAGREEEPIEGEFREIPTGPEEAEEGGWWTRRQQRRQEEKQAEPAREAEYLSRIREEAATRGWPAPETYEEAVVFKKQEREYFELGREVEEAGRRKKLLELEKAKAELAKTKRELGKEGARKLGRAATLGGVPAVQRPGGIREMYFGRAKQSLYVPKVPGKEPLGDLSKLREVTQLGAPTVRTDVEYARGLVAPPGRPSRQPLQYTFLRELLMPKGLSRIEQYAFAEIRANHDVDTARHIVQELAKLGVPRRESESAIKGLLQRGYVRRTSESAGEEPTLEIVKR